MAVDYFDISSVVSSAMLPGVPSGTLEATSGKYLEEFVEKSDEGILKKIHQEELQEKCLKDLPDISLKIVQEQSKKTF